MTPKPIHDLKPFPPARLFLRLQGDLSDGMASAIRRRHTGRLTLRIRIDPEATVEVWRRAMSRWVITAYTGRDVQHLLPRARSEDIQLHVIGHTSGVVELVD